MIFNGVSTHTSSPNFMWSDAGQTLTITGHAWLRGTPGGDTRAVLELSEQSSGLGNFFIGSVASGSGNMLQIGEGAHTFVTVRSDDDSGDLLSRGNVGIGTTTPAFPLHVNGAAGKPGGGSWSVASDRRLKKNVVKLDGTLDRLLKLRGVAFEYSNPAAINELSGIQTGMVAQDIEQVFPEWVAPADDGFKRVTYRGFEALTVEALRDLREEKDRQLAEVAASLTGIIRQQGALIEHLRSEVEALKRANDRKR